MMHIAYPNVVFVQSAGRSTQRFAGCGRYRALPLEETLEEPYHTVADPKTGNRSVIHEALERLVPEWPRLATTVTLYEKVDELTPDGKRFYQGESLDLAYFLALTRHARRLVLESLQGLGDLWCTGRILWSEGRPTIHDVESGMFTTKLEGFLAHAHDRLFVVPVATLTSAHSLRLRDAGVPSFSLDEFAPRLQQALQAGTWPERAVVTVGLFDLHRLVHLLFDAAPAAYGHLSGGALPRQPYKGLAAYEPQDADLFGGREHEITTVLRLLDTGRLVVLYGASGTGKTSLLQAGVLPRLAAERYTVVTARFFEGEPTQTLKAALRRQRPVIGWAADQPLVECVHAAAQSWGTTLVLVLDQFEEFFLRFPLPVRAAFARELGACVAEARLALRVVLALREDFYGHLGEFQDTCPDLFAHTRRLTALTLPQAHTAIRQPAAVLHLPMDDTFVTEVLVPQLADAEGAIEPPMLQLVCQALYNYAAERGRPALEPEAYGALGDLCTLLARHLDEVVTRFVAADQAAVRAVLKALVSAAGTKRTVTVADLVSRLHTAGVPLAPEVLETFFLRRLVQDRLVRLFQAPEADDGLPRYELLHEFLVAPIAAWMSDQERQQTLVLELIGRAYEGYRLTGLLLEPQALALIAPWREVLVLPPAQQQFVVALQDMARRLQRRRWRRVGAAVLGAVVVVGGSFSIQLYWTNQQLQTANAQLVEETDKAERRAEEAQQRLTALYREQGRQELLGGRAHQAAVYLSAAYQRGDTSPVLRLLLADAMRPLDALLATLGGHSGKVIVAQFSPDGTRVLTSGDETAELWDTTTGRMLTAFEGHTEAVVAAQFSPDGTHVVTVSGDKTAKLWDTVTGALLVSFEGHTNWLVTAQFSPDGTRIATASQDGTAKVWDVVTGDLLVSFDDHTAWVTAVQFSADGTQVLTASGDKTAKLWDAASGDLLVSFEGHTSEVLAAQFSPDGTRIVTASHDETAKVWDTASGLLFASLEGHTARVVGAQFSPDGTRIVTASHDKTAKVWDAATGRLRLSLVGHTAGVSAAQFSLNNTYILTSGDKTAKLWNAVTGRLLTSLEGHAAAIWTAQFSPDGTRIVTAGEEDETAKLWDAAPGALLMSLQGHTALVAAAQFSPDGTRIVTASADGTAKVWDAMTGHLRASLEGYVTDDAGLSAQFSPDSTRIVTAGRHSTCNLWDTTTGDFLATLDGRIGEAKTVQFSPDGTRIVTAGGETAKLWEAATGLLLASLEGHTYEVQHRRFSPDGTRIVTAGEGTAKLWDVATGHLLASLEGHTGWVWAAQFSPDSTQVLTASNDGTAKLWDAATGRLLASFSHPGVVKAAQFSPDGTRVLTAGGDGTAKLWDIHPETRSPAEIAALVRCRALWRLDDEGRLLPTTPEATACPPPAPAAVPRKVGWQTQKASPARRAWLGIQMKPSTEPLGVYIEQVIAESPAAHAGLPAHGVIVRFKTQEVHDPETLLRLVGSTEIGTTVDVEIIHDGQTQTIPVTLRQRPVVAP